METKRLQFHVEVLTPLNGSGGAYRGLNTLEVEFYGGSVFHGISLSHIDDTKHNRRGHAFQIVSRTTVGESTPKPDVLTTERYTLHTTTDRDPLLATSRAITHHLEELIPTMLDDRGDLAKALETDPSHLMNYRDQVVEPIRSAVLGICREPALLEPFDDGGLVWAVGTWKFAVLAPKALASALAMGTRVQDVLVVPVTNRGEITNILR